MNGVPFLALRLETASQADAIVAEREKFAVAVAVVDPSRRSVLYGSVSLPMLMVTNDGADPLKAVQMVCDELGVVPANPCVLVDVAPSRSGQPCELRFAIVAQPGYVAPDHMQGMSLRWLKVDVDAPFYTPDWMLLTTAIQELLAGLTHPQ